MVAQGATRQAPDAHGGGQPAARGNLHVVGNPHAPDRVAMHDGPDHLGQMLAQRSPTSHVEDLHTPAGRQHGQA